VKHLFITSLSLLTISFISACNHTVDKTTDNAQMNTPPVAKKVPYEMKMHSHKRIDNYYWLRDDQRKDPEVLAYLEAENQYTQHQLAHTQGLQQQLFEEMKGRIQKDDNSVPIKKGQYFYSTEMQGDNEYPIHVRSTDFLGSEKQVLLDINELAKSHNYYSVSGVSASPSGQLLAYGEDTVSRRIYTVKVKDLSTGTLLNDEIKNTSGHIVWADEQSFYYINKDPQTLLGYQVFRHVLGTPQSEDVLVYEESDNTYYTYVSKSKDGQFAFIRHSSTESSGVSIIDLNKDKNKAERFIARTKGLEYNVAKLNDWFYIYTNLDAKNFRLMKVKNASRQDTSAWQEVIPHSHTAMLEDFELFHDHLVYKVKEHGINSVFIKTLSSGEIRQLNFNDKAFASYLYGNNELDNAAIRIYYTSLTTPATHYDFNLGSGEAKVLKQQNVLGDFNADNYQSERFFIEARDGKKVPVSLVYHKEKFKKDGTNPLYQYAYGSYGSTREPTFSSNRLSLLNRGFVYAIAHVRGSEMLGRAWYEDGKKLTKKNTFNDFIDVTKALTAKGYGDKNKIFASGGSAGGLLMGAIMNQAPELYHGVAAHVPFVDVVTTMLDESIPLTTNEYDEWGNPNDKVYYDYMLSYSPYDQVKTQNYPNTLVTTGLHDSQVQYFEPAKWVAKLRDYKTDNNSLLLKTDMTAGHGGASGRFKRLNDSALEYAFFIDLLTK